MNMEMIIQSTGRSCTREQLKSTEFALINALLLPPSHLKTLNWHLLSGTLADWILYFVRCLNKEGVVPFDTYYRCMDLCDRIVIDYNVMAVGLIDV